MQKPMTKNELVHYVFHVLERTESTIGYLCTIPRYAEKHTSIYETENVGRVIMYLCDTNYHFRKIDDIVLTEMSQHRYLDGLSTASLLDYDVTTFLIKINRLSFINKQL